MSPIRIGSIGSSSECVFGSVCPLNEGWRSRFLIRHNDFYLIVYGEEAVCPLPVRDAGKRHRSSAEKRTLNRCGVSQISCVA